MSTKYLLADDLKVITKFVPEINYSEDMLPGLRQLMAADIKLSDPEKFDVERREVSIPLAGQPNVHGLLYIPKSATQTSSSAAYLHFHGGGFIIGSAEASDPQNLALASGLGIVVLSLNYRLAPENPMPAPLHDAYAGLAWLHQNAETLGVNTDKIAVGGESAGGGLAAALAIYARDLGEYKICHQHLTFPMLDNLTGDEQHAGDPLVGEFVWTRTNNQFAWSSVLGNQPAIAPQVPARLESFDDLPRAWIHTVQLDLFRDENIAYAQRLMQAGITTELVVYPGACHGFQLIPNTKAGTDYTLAHDQGLARGLGLIG